jgi:hypothetical protein
MLVSRRQLLRCGPALLAAAAVPWKMLGAANDDGDRLLSQPKSSFVPLLRNTFTVNASSIKPTWLMLESIEEPPAPAPSYETGMVTRPKTPSIAPPKMETFTLHFSATGYTLPQGTYELEHNSLGRIHLFLVPAGPSAYTAVVSHLLEPLPANYSIPQHRNRGGGATPGK